MPLASDLGLIREQDLLPIGAQAHPVELQVEVKPGKGVNVLQGPVAQFHMLKHHVLAYVHLSP